MNFPSSTISESHRVMGSYVIGSYLKMAPHREGGAGSGARFESASLLLSSESEQLDGSPTEYSESDTGNAESDVEI